MRGCLQSKTLPAPGRKIHEPLHLRIQDVRRHAVIEHEIEQLFHGQRRDASAPEEGVYVLDVLPQKVQSARVVQVH